jgi:hypothetical protein
MVVTSRALNFVKAIEDSHCEGTVLRLLLKLAAISGFQWAFAGTVPPKEPNLATFIPTSLCRNFLASGPSATTRTTTHCATPSCGTFGARDRHSLGRNRRKRLAISSAAGL